MTKKQGKAMTIANNIHCDMNDDCTEPIAYLDSKGYIYCVHHGQQRKQVTRCRKLTPAERTAILSGHTLVEY